MSGNMNFGSTASTELRNLGQDIIEIYSPILPKMDTSSSRICDEALRQGLKRVNQYLEMRERKYEELDQEIAILRKTRHVKYISLGKKVKECSSTIKELDEKVNLENSEEKTTAHIEYLTKLKEEVELQIAIKRLERIIQCNPQNVGESLEKAHTNLQTAVDEMEKSCREKENLINQYEKLGPQFQDLRIQHEAQEEEIKTKLWVKEQLMEMGLSDDDTMNESLF